MGLTLADLRRVYEHLKTNPQGLPTRTDSDEADIRANMGAHQEARLEHEKAELDRHIRRQRGENRLSDFYRENPDVQAAEYNRSAMANQMYDNPALRKDMPQSGREFVARQRQTAEDEMLGRLENQLPGASWTPGGLGTLRERLDQMKLVKPYDPRDVPIDYSKLTDEDLI